jgi:hypothetical protein
MQETRLFSTILYFSLGRDGLDRRELYELPFQPFYRADCWHVVFGSERRGFRFCSHQKGQEIVHGPERHNSQWVLRNLKLTITATKVVPSKL